MVGETPRWIWLRARIGKLGGFDTKSDRLGPFHGFLSGEEQVWAESQWIAIQAQQAKVAARLEWLHANREDDLYAARAELCGASQAKLNELMDGLLTWAETGLEERAWLMAVLAGELEQWEEAGVVKKPRRTPVEPAQDASPPHPDVLLEAEAGRVPSALEAGLG